MDRTFTHRNTNKITGKYRNNVDVILLQLDIQLPMQSVPITTKDMSSNPTYGRGVSIQHYVIKFVSDLRQFGGFIRVLRFPPPIKLNDTP